MDISEDFIEMLESSLQSSYCDFFVLRADNIMMNNNFNNLINSICLKYKNTIIHFHNDKICIFQIDDFYFKMFIGDTRDESHAINVERYNHFPV